MASVLDKQRVGNIEGTNRIFREDKKMKRTITLTAVFSLFLSAAIFVSVKMPTDFFTVRWLGICPADSILFAVIYGSTTLILLLVNHFLDHLSIRLGNRKVSCIAAYLVIFLGWFAFFLSFYPGNLSPDSYSSIYQALNKINSTAHPVLFTLLVKVCMQTGLYLFRNMNAAIATFSIIQMLLLDGILTYVIYWLQKHRIPAWMLVLTILYFTFHPLIVRFSFTMWKDILFSGVMVLLVLHLYDIATDEVSLQNNRTILKLVVLSVLVSFLRNRIIYGVVAIYILLLIIYRSYWKKLLPVFLTTAALVFLIQGPFYDCLAIKPSNFAEGQGVTLQQIAAVVVNNGELSEEDAEFINQIIPLEDIPKAYRESTVDSLKGYESFDHGFLNAHANEYWKVWRRVVIKNPWICIKAWLMTSRGFWGFDVWIEPFAITWPSEKLGIFQVNYIQKWIGVDLSYLSNGILVKLDHIPVVGRFFELGCMGWFGAFCFLRTIIQKRYRILISLLPLLLLWLVLIFSTPILFQARYMFALNLALPVLICMTLLGEKMEHLEEQI